MSSAKLKHRIWDKRNYKSEVILVFYSHKWTYSLKLDASWGQSAQEYLRGLSHLPSLVQIYWTFPLDLNQIFRSKSSTDQDPDERTDIWSERTLVCRVKAYFKLSSFLSINRTLWSSACTQGRNTCLQHREQSSSPSTSANGRPGHRSEIRDNRTRPAHW